MLKSVRSSLAVAVIGAFLTVADPAQAGSFPSDAEVRKILADRVDALGGSANGVGIVIGLVGPEGRKVFSFGRAGQSTKRQVSGDTAFEIGSVTKVFTALLLSAMLREGEVALTDPVAKHLALNPRLPERNGRSITLLDLATHTSGLPFMPKVPSLKDSDQLQAPSSQIYQFLASYEPLREAGVHWDYSNIGYWLLGQALASRAGMDFETLLRTRVIAPLRLKNTAITLSRRMKRNLTPGLTAVLQPASPISSIPIYGEMAAAGGLVSTASDLLSFLSIAMGYEPSPLAQAMTAMLATRRPMGRPEESQALGWVVAGSKDDLLIFHEGGTGGYASALAWDPRDRIGVVVLSNQVASVGDIARHLLRSKFPLSKPTAVKRTEVALESIFLDRYAGEYELHGGGALHLNREVDFLSMQLPIDWGLPALRLRAENEREFFVAEFPIRVILQTDSEKRVSGLLIDPGRGKPAVPALRISPIQ